MLCTRCKKNETEKRQGWCLACKRDTRRAAAKLPCSECHENPRAHGCSRCEPCKLRRRQEKEREYDLRMERSGYRPPAALPIDSDSPVPAALRIQLFEFYKEMTHAD